MKIVQEMSYRTKQILDDLKKVSDKWGIVFELEEDTGIFLEDQSGWKIMLLQSDLNTYINS